MNIKLLILSFPFFLTSTSIGQSLKTDTFNTPTIDTSSSIRWQCRVGPSVSKEVYPLVIINGKAFKNCLLQNIFFDVDTTTIATVRVLNPKNDSVKFYGKAGQNGVIIITTKRSIKWVSARQILKQKSSALFGSHNRTLIKVGKVFFDTDVEIYFQKDLIDNISVANNKTQSYMGRQYNTVVSINLTEKSGT